uniref:LRRCT domain-containing protein n=1 Tax=Panagrellus redivivus TaxID=6233 RepID=A0A7E4VLR5_PANRE
MHLFLEFNCVVILVVLLDLGFTAVINSDDEELPCPGSCLCEEEDTLFCNSIELQKVPGYWPNHYRKVVLRNVSLTTLHKASFKRFKALEELRIEECFQLDMIDKYAFKGLHKLRILAITRNPKLTQIYKATFSGIGNENSLKIFINNNALTHVQPYSFKNVQNIRELTIEDECVSFGKNSLSSILKLDFAVLRGVCHLAAETFSNTTRVHNLHISDSNFDLVTRAFAGLTHVNHILLQNNRINTIHEDAFGGSSTIGNLQIQTNKIIHLEPRAFAATENLGSVVFMQNTITQALRSPECIYNEAQKFVFSDNTLKCDCALKWARHHSDRTFLKENFCGREEAFKALIYYEPQGCPTEPPPIEEPSTRFFMTEEPPLLSTDAGNNFNYLSKHTSSTASSRCSLINWQLPIVCVLLRSHFTQYL